MLFEKEIKKLGFGLMRLPQKDGAIDIEQVKVMVDHFMDAGFTYFDTAWAYPGSEDAIPGKPRRLLSAIRERASSWQPRMPHGSTVRQEKTRSRSSRHRWHRREPDISIPICSTIWERCAHITLKILTCGISFAR